MYDIPFVSPLSLSVFVVAPIFTTPFGLYIIFIPTPKFGGSTLVLWVGWILSIDHHFGHGVGGLYWRDCELIFCISHVIHTLLGLPPLKKNWPQKKRNEKELRNMKKREKKWRLWTKCWHGDRYTLWGLFAFVNQRCEIGSMLSIVVEEFFTY